MSVLCQKLPTSRFYEENTVSQFKDGIKNKRGHLFPRSDYHPHLHVCMCKCKQMENRTPRWDHSIGMTQHARWRSWYPMNDGLLERSSGFAYLLKSICREERLCWDFGSEVVTESLYRLVSHGYILFLLDCPSGRWKLKDEAPNLYLCSI